MSKKSDEGRIVAVLSYILIGIIWYFVDDKIRGKNAFAKFHVQQALVLLIFSIAISILNGILSAIFGFIAVFTLGIGSALLIIPLLISFIPLIFWLFGVVYALQGSKKELPWIGRYGKEFKI
tara:strand:- start:2183 stop:2548 length:366 start_codon:yes stop_codon:yes gene_type:complete